MMLRRDRSSWCRLSRAIALVVLVLQATLTSLVPTADAVVAARATTGAGVAAGHAHAPEGAPCSTAQSQHCTEHCVLCRLLATGAEVPLRTFLRRPSAKVGAAIASEQRVGARPGRTTAFPRAPPVG